MVRWALPRVDEVRSGSSLKAAGFHSEVRSPCRRRARIRCRGPPRCIGAVARAESPACMYSRVIRHRHGRHRRVNLSTGSLWRSSMCKAAGTAPRQTQPAPFDAAAPIADRRAGQRRWGLPTRRSAVPDRVRRLAPGASCAVAGEHPLKGLQRSGEYTASVQVDHLDRSRYSPRVNRCTLATPKGGGGGRTAPERNRTPPAPWALAMAGGCRIAEEFAGRRARQQHWVLPARRGAPARPKERWCRRPLRPRGRRRRTEAAASGRDARARGAGAPLGGATVGSRR